MKVYQRLGIRTVINALGYMTSIGGAPILQSVSDAMADAAQANVDIDLYHDKLGEALATGCGTEDACVCNCAAAGIVLATAAAIAGTDPGNIGQLPNTDGLEARILIPAGQCVDFGAPIEQMVAMAGGQVVRVGSVNLMTEDHLRAALRRGGAAFLYVTSHHAVHKGLLSFADVARIVKGESNMPLIVDAAAEDDLTRFSGSEADCVIYSGSKAVHGPVSGLMIGSRAFIRTCRAQFHGLGRPLKVGKENMAGLLAAVEGYLAGGREQADAHRRRVTGLIVSGLDGLPHTRVEITPDEVRPGLDRVTLRVQEDQLGFGVREIFEALAQGDPPVRARPHMMNLGELGFDCRIITEEQAAEVVRQVHAFYQLQEVL